MASLIRLTLRGFVTTTTAYARREIGGVAAAATARKRPSATGINTVAQFGTLVIEAPVQGANQVTSFVIAVIREAPLSSLEGVIPRDDRDWVVTGICI